jgi:hypothetical protein
MSVPNIQLLAFAKSWFLGRGINNAIAHSFSLRMIIIIMPFRLIILDFECVTSSEATLSKFGQPVMADFPKEDPEEILLKSQLGLGPISPNSEIYCHLLKDNNTLPWHLRKGLMGYARVHRVYKHNSDVYNMERRDSIDRKAIENLKKAYYNGKQKSEEYKGYTLAALEAFVIAFDRRKALPIVQKGDWPYGPKWAGMVALPKDLNFLMDISTNEKNSKLERVSILFLLFSNSDLIFHFVKSLASMGMGLLLMHMEKGSDSFGPFQLAKALLESITSEAELTSIRISTSGHQTIDSLKHHYLAVTKKWIENARVMMKNDKALSGKIDSYMYHQKQLSKYGTPYEGLFDMFLNVIDSFCGIQWNLSVMSWSDQYYSLSEEIVMLKEYEDDTSLEKWERLLATYALGLIYYTLRDLNNAARKLRKALYGFYGLRKWGEIPLPGIILLKA